MLTITLALSCRRFYLIPLSIGCATSFVCPRCFVCELIERAVGLPPLPFALSSQLPPARNTQPPGARRAWVGRRSEGASRGVGGAPREWETGTRDALSVGRSRRGLDRPRLHSHAAAAGSENARTQGEKLTHACELYAPVMCPALCVHWLVAPHRPRSLLSPLPFPCAAPLAPCLPSCAVESVRSSLNPRHAQQQTRATHTKHIRAIRSDTCFCTFPVATSCAVAEAAWACQTACPRPCNLCPPQPRRSRNCPVKQQRRHQHLAALA
jgi:hypothetical protein